MSAAVIASLAAGLIVSQWQRRIADRRLADVRGLAAQMLEVEQEMRDTPGGLGVRKNIVESVVRSLDQMRSEVRNDTRLRIEVAAAYRRVAEVQAARAKSSFGLYRESLASLEKAEKLLNEVRAAEPNNQVATKAWFGVESEIAGRLYDSGEKKKGIQLADETGSQLRRYLERYPATEADEALLEVVYAAASRLLLNGGRTVDALRYSDLRTEVSVARANRLRTPETQIAAAASLRVHGTAQRYAGELEGALESFRKAAALLPADPQNARARRERQEIAFTRGLTLGEAQGLSLGRFDEGASSLREAAGILNAIITGDSADGEARVNLSQTCLKLGQILLRTDPRAVLDTFEEGLRGLAPGPETNRYVREYRLKLKFESSVVLANLGRREEGDRLFEEAMAEVREIAKDWPPKRFGSTSLGEGIWRGRAELAAAKGRTRDAIATYQEVVEMIRANGEAREQDDLDDAVRMSVKLARIAELFVKAGDVSQAAAYRRDRVELWRKWQAKLPGNAVVGRQLDAANVH